VLIGAAVVVWLLPKGKQQRLIRRFALLGGSGERENAVNGNP
jgi:hypothetical protein